MSKHFNIDTMRYDEAPELKQEDGNQHSIEESMRGRNIAYARRNKEARTRPTSDEDRMFNTKEKTDG